MKFFFFSKSSNSDSNNDNAEEVKSSPAAHGACDLAGNCNSGGGDVAVCSDNDSNDQTTLEDQARRLEELNRSLHKIR